MSKGVTVGERKGGGRGLGAQFRLLARLWEVQLPSSAVNLRGDKSVFHLVLISYTCSYFAASSAEHCRSE